MGLFFQSMSLYNFIYNLQRKPDHAKKRVMIVLLVFCFIILSAFWVFMFKRQVSGVDVFSLKPRSQNQLAEPTKSELLSPVAALLEGFKGLKSDITAKLKDATSRLSDSTTSPSETRARKVYELPKW